MQMFLSMWAFALLCIGIGWFTGQRALLAAMRVAYASGRETRRLSPTIDNAEALNPNRGLLKWAWEQGWRFEYALGELASARGPRIIQAIRASRPDEPGVTVVIRDKEANDV